MKCPKCQCENRKGARFCNECGHGLRSYQEASPIDYNQPETYTPRHIADKILTTRSSLKGERKLLTIFFADMAGYTSMAEKIDPEDVHNIMDGCFRILMEEIHRYEGTVNQFTGDGVMALFGAPVAHENHAQRACHAALNAQKALGEYGDRIMNDYGFEFRMRMGINSGSVIVGVIGDDLRMGYTAVGDTTNLASRMERLAKPGTILVSRATCRLARAFFEFKSLGKIEVKGKKEPQEAFELIKTREVKNRLMARSLTCFVGRKNSMSALMKAYEKTKAGSGQVVELVGEAGVGKSRLLLEFRKRLPQVAFSYLEGQCIHYGRSMAYRPLIDILKSYFDIKEGDREGVIKGKIEGKMAGFGSELSETLPPFQLLLSLKVDDEAFLKMEPQQRQQRTFEAIRDLVVHMSQNKALVIAVEDLHWIDRTSEDFLDYLIGWLPNTQIMLILLYRSEYTPPWGSKSCCNRIGVNQLTVLSSGELAQASLEVSELEAELKELILSRAAGNPFFIEEFTHSLLEKGSIERRKNRYVLKKKPFDIQIPDTIQGIVAARIDHLGQHLKRIIQVASAIGREFPFRILQAITGMREDLKPYLLSLQNLEFIHEKNLSPELKYIFKHALIQEVAYNSLLTQRRREIHKKIGQAMEEIYSERLEELCEILAHHYVLGDNRQKAVEYLTMANQKAARINALQEGKAYFDQAMKILDNLPETRANQEQRILLLINQLFVFQLLFKMSEYYDLLTRYETMVTALSDTGLLGAFYARRGTCEWWAGYLDQSVKTCSRACELLKIAGEKEDLGLAYIGLQWAYLWMGNFTQVVRLEETALRLMTEQLNPRLCVLSLTCASWAYAHMGNWKRAVEEAQKGMRIAEEYANKSLMTFAAHAMSVVYNLRGDFGRSLEYGEKGAQSAPTPADRVWSQAMLGWAYCRIGDPVKGIEILTKVASMYHAVQFYPAEIYMIVSIGEGYFRCGDGDAAAVTLHKGLALAERSGMRFLVGYAHRLLGETVLEANPKQAITHFTEAISAFKEIGAENELTLAHMDLGRIQKKKGT